MCESGKVGYYTHSFASEIFTESKLLFFFFLRKNDSLKFSISTLLKNQSFSQRLSHR